MGIFRKECPNSESGRHEWKVWRNEKHPNTEKKMGPGEHLVFHCHRCGKIKDR